MAQHIPVNKIDQNSYIRKAVKSIQKRIAYLRGLYMPKHIKQLGINKNLFIFGKNFFRLPDEYAGDKYYVAFCVGDYFVGKRLVWGGYANFEVHYNPDTRDTRIYMVA